MIHLPELPYEYTALEPYMSKESLEYHHDKHHKTYVDFVNNYIKEHREFAHMTLEEMIIVSSKDVKLTALFNNAAQVFNHNAFWPTLKAHEVTKVPSELEKKLKEDFGSVTHFKEALVKAGTTLFGSGWAWLTLEAGKLVIKKYQNGGTPIAHDLPAIMPCDVWEHSYYIDYRNKRAEYMERFVNHLINWEHVNEMYLKAIGNLA